MYTSMDELQQAIAGVLRLDGNTPSITNEQRLLETSIDQFVLSALFATDPEVKTQARSTIRQLAQGLGIRSAKFTWRPVFKTSSMIKCQTNFARESTSGWSSTFMTSGKRDGTESSSSTPHAKRPLVLSSKNSGNSYCYHQYSI